MKQPLISVILPNYNHAPYLKDRLDSIFEQTYPNFEVIILDDASTDESPKILNAYKDHPKVSHFVCNAHNTGSPFKQWYKGLQLAKGEFIWIAESDDKADRDFLKNQLGFLENNNVDVVVAETLKFNDEEGVYGTVGHPIFAEKNNQKLEKSSILFCPILNVSAVLFKAETVDRIESFQTYRIIGDRVFYHEAFLNRSIAYNTATKSYFRKSNDSVSALDNRDISYYKSYFYEHLRFIKKVDEQSDLPKTLFNEYVTRFFNRVRYRMKRSEKFNFTFLGMLIKYKRNLK